MIERGVNERQKDLINQTVHKILPDFEIEVIQLEVLSHSSSLLVRGKTNEDDKRKYRNVEEELENLAFVDFADIDVTGNRQ